MHDGHLVGRGPAGDRLGDLAPGDHRGDGTRADRVPLLVDDEAPVGVPVEGDADVGAVAAHPLLQIDEVGRVEGVGLVVGEGPVELEVHRVEGERQRRQPGLGPEDCGHGEATHAVAGVDAHPQRPGAREVDERAQEGGVLGEDVSVARLPLRPLREPGTVTAQLLLGDLPDPGEPGVLTDGPGAGTAELDAVVLGGVVARGEHRARQAERAAGVVEPVGARQTDEDGVDAAGGQTLGERRREVGRARPHVVADDDGGGALRVGDHLGEGDAQRVGDPLVELLRDEPADVVGLDEVCKRDGHGPQA